MWIVLTIIAFVVGQVYLFHCLRKLDRFLDKQPLEPKDDSSGNSEEDML